MGGDGWCGVKWLPGGKGFEAADISEARQGLLLGSGRPGDLEVLIGGVG